MSSAALRWGLVVPVKRLALAKTRLGPPLGAYADDARQDLALAFASDVVAAGVRCPLIGTVLVVTDDQRAGQTLALLGAQVVADNPDAGLNPALEHGAELVRSRFAADGVATVSADLPCLTAEILADALSRVGEGTRAFAADASGRGTTLLAAGPGAALSPAYGPGSAQRHRGSGATELAAVAALRLDVDTEQDLARALALGVGAATAAVTRRLRDWVA